ncbi:MAG: hypothetical protein NVS3B26_24410 [Mycobacteriales bacterium]
MGKSGNRRDHLLHADECHDKSDCDLRTVRARAQQTTAALHHPTVARTGRTVFGLQTTCTHPWADDGPPLRNHRRRRAAPRHERGAGPVLVAVAR